MTQPFKPDVITKEGIINVEKLNGYLLALRDIQLWMKEKTQFNPDRRHIDSVELLESIQATTPVIKALMKEATEQLFTVHHKIFTQTSNQ